MADDGAAVARTLEAWLRGRGVEASVEVEERATVGLSQETWLLRVAAGGGEQEAVLRLPTPASGARAVLTQRAALQAVEGSGVPAPRLLWSDDGDDNGFGRPFFVMERARGTVPVGWHVLPEPARTRLAGQAIEALALLHAVDPAPLAATQRGPGPTELAWYLRRFERLEPLPPVVRAALWWLERHEPPPTTSVLVHGDYRMGNMVVDGDRIAGVLDWEMASPGDPLSDLAWCFIPVWEPPGVDEAALARLYAERSGTEVDAARLAWHRILGYARLVYYGLSGTRAFDAGHSADLRLAALRLQLPVTLDRLAAALAGRPPV